MRYIAFSATLFLVTILGLASQTLRHSARADEPSKGEETVKMRYHIAHLPVWKMDESGKPIFDASVVMNVIQLSAGREAWGEGTELSITPDGISLVVVQTKSNQQKIVETYRDLCKQQGMTLSQDGEPLSVELTKAELP